MGNTDSIPVISQLKSAVQAISRDTEGAKGTQNNFVRGCPLVSQVTSAVQWVRGDLTGAKETQKYFIWGISSILDSIPLIGHTKAALHYFYNSDKDRAKASVLAASRTVGVIGGGIGGGIIFGPCGAAVGGIIGGAITDGLFTAAESSLNGRPVSHGYFYFVQQARKGHLDAGSAFDFLMMPVFDGLVGGAYAKVYKTMQANIVVSEGSLNAVVVSSTTAQTAVNTTEATFECGDLPQKFQNQDDYYSLNEARDDFQLIDVDST